MSATGLPATVERTLTALLTDNIISSWKITADDSNNIVFVMRMKPAGNSLSTGMADPVLNRNTQVQYRRKPPCQIRRDEEKARQHREKQLSRQCNSEFVETPPLFSDIALDHANEETETEIQQADTCRAQCVEITSDLSTTTVQLDLPCGPTTDSTMDSVTHVEHSNDSTAVGFDTAVVKAYVSTLTDGQVQRRLRDSQRNQHFRKAVISEIDSSEVLMFESDDIVMEYSCSPDTDAECTYWYVKREDRRMLAEERVKLSRLRRGKRRPNTQHYTEIQARAEQELQILHALMKFYMK